MSQDLDCPGATRIATTDSLDTLCLSRIGKLRREVERARDYSAGTLLIMVVLASILPFLLVGSFLLWKYVEQERAEAVHRVVAYSDSISAAVDRELDGYVESLQVLASSAAARSLPGNFALVDRSGQLLINTQAAPGTPLPMAADPEGVRRVFDMVKADISDLVPGAVHDRYIFSIRWPVTVNEEVQYALGYVPTANKVLSIVPHPRSCFF
jgi:hypothetical protein